MPVIEAHNVYKIFGRKPERGVSQLQQGASREVLRDQGLTPAVIDASFDVAQGEIFVVMGLSGSGKGEFNRSMQHRLFGATVVARRRPRPGCASRGLCGAGC